MSARLAQKNAQAVAAIQALCAHKAALLDTLAATTSAGALAGTAPGSVGTAPIPTDTVLSTLNRTFAHTFDTADIQWW